MNKICQFSILTPTQKLITECCLTLLLDSSLYLCPYWVTPPKKERTCVWSISQCFKGPWADHYKIYGFHIFVDIALSRTNGKPSKQPFLQKINWLRIGFLSRLIEILFLVLFSILYLLFYFWWWRDSSVP